MAFENTPYQTEEEKKDEGMQPLSSGTSGQFQTGGGGEQRRAPVEGKGSGQFTNIQKYMKSSETGKRMAQQIAGNLQKETGQIEQETQKQLQPFEKIAQTEQKRLETAGERAKRYIQEAGTQSQEESARRAAELKGLREGQGEYRSLQDVDLSKQSLRAQQLQKMASGLQTEKGARQSLRETFQRPDYTQGMKNLDYLMMRQKGAQEELGKAGRDIKSRLDTLNVGEREQRAIAQKQALQNLAQSYQIGGSADLNKQLQLAREGQQTSLQQRFEDEQKRRADLVNQLNLQDVVGYDPSNLQSKLIKQDLYTEADVARARALARLSETVDPKLEKSTAYETLTPEAVAEFNRQLTDPTSEYKQAVDFLTPHKESLRYHYPDWSEFLDYYSSQYPEGSSWAGPSAGSLQGRSLGSIADIVKNRTILNQLKKYGYNI